jgi:hypothetical protein
MELTLQKLLEYQHEIRTQCDDPSDRRATLNTIALLEIARQLQIMNLHGIKTWNQDTGRI